MEETFTEKAIHALVFVAICAAIVRIGWNEPLRYRFLTEEQFQEMQPPTPTPMPAPTPSALLSGERQGTQLNKPAARAPFRAQR